MRRFIKNTIYSQPICLAAIFTAALLARILWIVYVKTEQVFDFAAYQQLAESIADGFGHTMDGVPVAWQGSAYPYLLGFFYKLIGTSDIIYGKILNIVMSMLTLAVCWLIYRKLFSKASHALTLLAVTALLPQYVAYVNVIGTEVFFTLILSLIVLTQIYYRDNRIAYIVIGVLTGAAALTRPFMLSYPAVCAAVMWATSKKPKQTLVFAGIVTAAALIVIAPWTYRNYRLFGRVIPVSYNAGYVLYTNYNDYNTAGTWMDLSKAAVQNPSALAVINESLEHGERSIKEAHDLERFLRDEAVGWIKENPGEFFKLGLMHIYQTFFVGVNDIEQWTMNLYLPPENADTLEVLRYERNYRLVGNIFDTITYIINAAGFLFCFAASARFIRTFFSKSGTLDNLTVQAVINIAFFAVVAFFYGGEARYAFPVFIFMIPAMGGLLWKE